MNKEPFDHGYKEHFGSINVEGIAGYAKALHHIGLYVCHQTELKPENRYSIDAAELLAKISETSGELSQLLALAEPHLSTRELEELLDFKLNTK